MRKCIINLAVFLLIGFWLFVSQACAEEVTILYTGQTHAMLYPCNCPKEPDGGIARRATLIRQLRQKHPGALLLDSGNFFAGGLLDEYTQNTQLDKKRTEINLKAAELSGYDALAVGGAEFNFGKEFLFEKMDKTKLPFLSCNINFSKFLPHIIKKVNGVKIGIIGVTSPHAAQKAGGLKFIEPKVAVAAQVNELTKTGVNIIVLLSNLDETDNLNLIKSIKGIDILIEGGASKAKPSETSGDTFIVRPSWQGRRLGSLIFSVKENKASDFKAQELRLSDKIKDDPQVLSILPVCFSDSNCSKDAKQGLCQNPGESNSACVFKKAQRVKLLVITTAECKACDTQKVIDSLKKHFPGLDISYRYYPGRKAKRLIKDFGISALPAYLLGGEIEKEDKFANFKKALQKKGDYYLLSPQASGIAYFIDRKQIKGRLDLFLSLHDQNSRQVLETTREFNPTLHFLAAEEEEGFNAANGKIEVEEYLRAVCVRRYYPEDFWDYISCRSADITSSWWEDCAGGLDTDKIKACARSSEGRSLLKENIALNKEVHVLFGPVYMVNNKEIFSSKGAPSKEELKKIIKR